MPGYIGAIFFGLLLALLSEVIKNNFLISYEKITEILNYSFFNLLTLNFIYPSISFIYRDNPLPYLNGSLWTIKIELILYLILPLIVYFIKKYKSLSAVVIAILISLIWAYYFIEIAPNKTILKQFPGKLIFFSSGIFLFYLLNIFKENSNILFLFLLLTMILNFTIENRFSNYAINVVFVLLSVYFFAFHTKKIKLKTDLSYSIYLLHYPLLQFYVSFNIFEKSLLLWMLVYFINLYFLSRFFWFFIEKKFIWQKKK